MQQLLNRSVVRRIDPADRERRRRLMYARAALFVATVAGAVIVSLGVKTFQFFWIVAVGITLAGAASLYFRSWTAVVFAAGVYLYLMVFWGIGFLGDYIDRVAAEAIATTTGIGRSTLKFLAFLGAWLALVIAIEIVLHRFDDRRRRRYPPSTPKAPLSGPSHSA